MLNIIYGAGVYGEIFYQEIEKSGIKIDFFIDQYTPKKTIVNKKIKRLDEADLSDARLFVSVTSPRVEQEILSDLKDKNSYIVFSFSQTISKFDSLIERCITHTKTWYSLKLEDMIDEEKISRFSELLKDKKSKELLSKIVRFRKDLKAVDYPTPDLDVQYFPKDIALFEHIDSIGFVDGGAFIGDTLSESLKEFKREQKEVNFIASFEPDRENIKKLSLEAQKQKKLHPKTDFLVYPCGLWSENSFLSFSENSSSNSSIINDVSEQKSTIMTVSLDETLIGASVNYIKMDIEGAEKEAIIGAKKIISTYSPVLAISLYHKPEDLWELPLLIDKINPNYDMYLRIYGSMGLELILYCVPNK